MANFKVTAQLNENEDNNLTGPYWLSPEFIQTGECSFPASDIWSLGCTIIKLLTGISPYFDLSSYTALYRIVHASHPELPGGISEDCKDFLMKCFEKNTDKRSRAYELLKHPWISAINL